MKAILIGLMLAFSTELFAAGLIIVNDLPEPDNRVPIERPPLHPLPPQWMPRPIFRHTPLEIRSVNATVRITDQVAQTEIEQEFYNPNPRQLEGTFILPLPKGAHLDKFRMEVNGKMTEAELLSADKARGIYEEIVRKVKDPALLEYMGRDLLKVRIFPIEPHSTKRIELKYSQVLNRDSGLNEYILPLNVARYCATPIKNFSMKLELRSGTPLKTLYSPSHSIEIIRNTDKTATIGLEQTDTRPEKDFQFFFSAEASELGISFLSYKRSGEDGYFMLLASPGLNQQKGKILPKDVVFVLDTSGSMNGPKLEQAKKALEFCVNNLNSGDRFEVVRFSTEAESLFKSLSDAGAENKKRAVEFVKELASTGGTAINDALLKALAFRPEKSPRPFVIVFLTDGQPTVGEKDPDAILKNVRTKNEGLKRIFCFGIGTDVNTRLLDTVAEQTGAIAQYILPDEDIEVKVSSFFTKISDPVLAGVNLEFDNIRTTKLHPGKLPDLFKGQQMLVFGRYKGGGKSSVRITGKVDEQTKTFDYPVNFTEQGREHDFIPRLWATRRVGYLLDEIRLRAGNDELKDEVTELAKKYGIVTPYTSYLVQEDQIPLQTGTHTAGDPLAFDRKNPELMKRYFPQLYSQSSGGAATPAPEAGAIAVQNSIESLALRSADSAQALSEVRQKAVAGRTVMAKERAPAAPAVELPEFCGGRTFYRKGDLWIDSEALSLENAPEKTIRFDSPEYYELAKNHPEILEWLALGSKLKFVLDGTVYRIVSE